MSKIGTIILTGCSGNEYSFDIYSFNTTFKPLSGIYYISKRNQKREHTAIYLGITDDLSSRFNNHHKGDCFVKNGANCISILLENSKERREEIEKDILCNYNFPCNDKSN